jgi:prolyl 4-hydroxylase
MPSSSSSSSSFSFLTLIQYTLFAVIAYFLAGAPLLSTFLPDASSAISKHAGASSGNQKVQLSYDMIESLMHPDPGLVCEEHGYRVHVLHREPLVVYVEGFLSEGERRRIVEIRYV